MLDFRLIKGAEIDKEKWDDCVKQSANGLIYAHSFFLDNMAPQWSGIVGGNYEWVLPIISRKKMGISYLYQPPFAQQFGVYSLPGIDVPFADMVSWLKTHFSFWEINWNAATAVLLSDDDVIRKPSTNFVLDLSLGHLAITQNYHADLVKNLKKANQFLLHYQPYTSLENCIDLYIHHYAERMPQVSKSDYDHFRKLCHFAKQNNLIYCRDAVTDNGEIAATALLLSDGKRLYNMMNTTTAPGRKMSANHFLMNNIIAEFSGEKMVLDFEGSDLPGVRPFYENFGTVNEPYFQIKYNSLPWPAKLFKR